MTAYNGGIPADQSDSFRVILCDLAAAEKAYLVYAAMKRAEIDQPTLINLPLWNSLKAVSFEWFTRCFDEMGV